MAIQLLDKSLVMKQKRSSMVKVQNELDYVENYDSDSENIYEEPTNAKFDEILGLLKGGNIYGESDSITLGAVDVPIEKQIAIDKASTKGLKSEEYKNTHSRNAHSRNKLSKLRKLRSGN